MAFYMSEMRKPKAIIPPTVASTSAANVSFISSTTYGQNFPLTFHCIAGDIHISTLTTAPTTAIGMKMTAGMSLDLMCQDYLSLVSTSTAATYQAIVWEK